MDEAESVYVVPRAVAFRGGDGWLGVDPGDPELLDRIAANGFFLARPTAEHDPSHKQIIPYLVLRDGERIFLMRRTRAGGDARLHDLYSIGVGGHLNPGDGDVFGCLRREWHEEIEANFEPDFELLGFLNDDTTDVGQVHLGVVFVADAAGRRVAIRETNKLSGSFEDLPAVRAVYGRMETWSQLVLDAIASEPFLEEGSRTDGA